MLLGLLRVMITHNMDQHVYILDRIAWDRSIFTAHMISPDEQ